MRRVLSLAVATAASTIAATAIDARPAALAGAAFDGVQAPRAELVQVQATPPATYRDKCASCHGPIEPFARRDVVLIDSVLRGKVNGQPVAAFLTKHGRLRPDEIPALVEDLTKALTAETPAAR